jgi:predicted nucleic acid-binding protein
MVAYVDSSVLLRIVLGEPEPLREFSQIKYAVSSELIRVECLRTMDRYRVRSALSEADYLEVIGVIHKLLSDIEQVKVTSLVLNRAAQSYPISLGTLDAIHLTTCLLYGERVREKVILCSHDETLKRAGRSMGIEVLG